MPLMVNSPEIWAVTFPNQKISQGAALMRRGTIFEEEQTRFSADNDV